MALFSQSFELHDDVTVLNFMDLAQVDNERELKQVGLQSSRRQTVHVRLVPWRAASVTQLMTTCVHLDRCWHHAQKWRHCYWSDHRGWFAWPGREEQMIPWLQALEPVATGRPAPGVRREVLACA